MGPHKYYSARRTAPMTNKAADRRGVLMLRPAVRGVLYPHRKYNGVLFRGNPLKPSTVYRTPSQSIGAIRRMRPKTKKLRKKPEATGEWALLPKANQIRPSHVMLPTLERFEMLGRVGDGYVGLLRKPFPSELHQRCWTCRGNRHSEKNSACKDEPVLAAGVTALYRLPPHNKLRAVETWSRVTIYQASPGSRSVRAAYIGPRRSAQELELHTSVNRLMATRSTASVPRH